MLATNTLLPLGTTKLLKLSKSLRGKMRALYVGLNLDDFVIITLASFVLSFSSFILPNGFIFPVTFLFALYVFLIWLDNWSV
jgi:hypothetical protein